MKIFYNKFLIIFLIVILVLVASVVFNYTQADISGCQGGNVRGYVWSDNVGWVSFSCLNHYNQGEGVNYGVDVNLSTGVISGYAWSDNVGWISFEESDLWGCPSGECLAKINSAGEIIIGGINGGSVTGWGKILSNNEWISFENINLQNDYFYGWGWGGGVVGWLSFNCADLGVCPQSDYKVWLEEPLGDDDDGITVENMTTIMNHCAKTLGMDTVAYWSVYNDDGMGLQFQFRFEGEGSNFTIEIWDGGSKVYERARPLPPGSNVSYTLRNQVLTGGTSYTWRVKIDDSNWTTSMFAVPSIPHPYVDFSYTPGESISVGEDVLFQSNSAVYSGSGSYLWTIESGSPNSGNDESIETHFTEQGEKEVRLRVTDGGGRSCQRIKTITIESALPGWEEISPGL